MARVNPRRARLVLLPALALRPASTLAIRQALANYEQVKGLTERSLLQSSAIVATEEKNEIVAARDALEGLAELGEVLYFVPHDCKQALLRFNARSKARFANPMGMRLDGVVACAIDLEQQHSFASSDRSEEHTSELQSLK